MPNDPDRRCRGRRAPDAVDLEARLEEAHQLARLDALDIAGLEADLRKLAPAAACWWATIRGEVSPN